MSSAICPYNFITQNQDRSLFECSLCEEVMCFNDKKKNPVLGNAPKLELRCRNCFELWKKKNGGVSKSVVTKEEFKGPQYREFPDELKEIWRRVCPSDLLDSKASSKDQVRDQVIDQLRGQLRDQRIYADNQIARLRGELHSARQQIHQLSIVRPAEPRSRPGSCCIVSCFRRLSRGCLYLLQSVSQVVSNCLRFLARTVYYCLRSCGRAIRHFLRIFFRRAYCLLRFCDRLVVDFFQIFSRIFSNYLHFSL